MRWGSTRKSVGWKGWWQRGMRKKDTGYKGGERSIQDGGSSVGVMFSSYKWIMILSSMDDRHGLPTACTTLPRALQKKQ